mmetsp:Transcript_12049/g.34422  ORF Transcript_12049/g.34422 Transcript_12049/m.34422 type:complete len:312 (+) Transcript_12049:1276-2211(+)
MPVQHEHPHDWHVLVLRTDGLRDEDLLVHAALAGGLRTPTAETLLVAIQGVQAEADTKLLRALRDLPADLALLRAGIQGADTVRQCDDALDGLLGADGATVLRAPGTTADAGVGGHRGRGPHGVHLAARQEPKGSRRAHARPTLGVAAARVLVVPGVRLAADADDVLVHLREAHRTPLPAGADDLLACGELPTAHVAVHLFGRGRIVLVLEVAAPRDVRARLHAAEFPQVHASRAREAICGHRFATARQALREVEPWPRHLGDVDRYAHGGHRRGLNAIHHLRHVFHVPHAVDRVLDRLQATEVQTLLLRR